jgi:hypothetical protein
MNDFLVALAISLGGEFLLSIVDSQIVNAQAQASCASLGGAWQWGQESPSVLNLGGLIRFGTCSKSAAAGPVTPISIPTPSPGVPGPVILFGPPVAAIAVTRSFPGVLGAAAGGVTFFLIGLSGIH